MADEITVRVTEVNEHVRRFYLPRTDMVRVGSVREVQFPAGPIGVYQYLTDEGRDIVGCLSEDDQSKGAVRSLLVTSLGFVEVKKRRLADWAAIMPAITAAFELVFGAERIAFEPVNYAPHSSRR